MTRRSRRARGVPLGAPLCFLAALTGCVGSSTPRKPTPPSQRQPTQARSVIDIRGIPDRVEDQLPWVHELERTPGVKQAFVDEATGNYVVDHDPRRLSRDELRVRILEIGRELQYEVHPIFEDR